MYVNNIRKGGKIMSKKWVSSAELVELFKDRVSDFNYLEILNDSRKAACSGLFKGYSLTFHYVVGKFLRVEIEYGYFLKVPWLALKEAIKFFSEALNKSEPVCPVCKFKLGHLKLKFVVVEWSKNPSWYEFRKILTQVDAPFITELKKLS